MTEWVIIFVVAVFALMIGGNEAERSDSLSTDWVKSYSLIDSTTSFEDGMEILDSLWTEIHNKEVMLIIETRQPTPCSINKFRKRDEPTYGCLVYHFKQVYDTTYVNKEYIFNSYRYPEFNEDSTVCHVEELRINLWK